MIRIIDTVKTLRDALRPIGAVSDECRLNISPEGLSVKVVDPANVALIDLGLPKKVFYEGEYIVDETLEIGLDVVTYSSLFKGAEDNESAELSIELYEEKGVQKHKLVLKIANIFEQTLTLMRPNELRKTPKFPTFTLRATAEVSKEFLKRCFDMAAKAGDYIRMIAHAQSGMTLFIMEAGEDETKFRVKLTTGVEITVEEPEARLKSLFSLDYLCEIVNTIEDGKTITMHLDKDCPLILNFNVLDYGQASFMQAPRIESE